LSYSELTASEKIDAVYIPLPTALHVDWVEKAARAGKHILLEKPLCLNAKALDRIWRACDAAKVVLLDGTMFMHHPRLDALSKEIQRLGPVQEVRASFHFQASDEFLQENIRTKKDLDGLGALGDLGWYTAKLALLAFGFERPTEAQAHAGAVTNGEGVLLRGGGTVVWSRGRVARMDYSFTCPPCQDATIVCESGTIRLDDFVLPRREDVAFLSVEENGTVVVPDDGPTEFSSEKRTVECRTDKPQEALMFEAFRRLCADPRGEEAMRWMQEARLTQEVLLALDGSGSENGRPVAM